MSTADGFADRVNTIGELPAPFRTLRERVPPQEAMRLLVHNPPFTILSETVPATVLAVTERRRLVLFAEAERGVSVDECGLGDTLLLELTSILLHGELRIDFTRGGGAHSTAVVFNIILSV